MALSPDTVKCFSSFWLVWENHCKLQKYQHFFYYYLNIFSLFLLSIFFLPWQSVSRRGWNWVAAHMEVNICGLNYWKIRKFKNKNKMNVRSPSSLFCYLFSFCIRSKNAFCHNNNNSLHYYPGISNYCIHIKVLCFLTCSQNEVLSPLASSQMGKLH